MIDPKSDPIAHRNPYKRIDLSQRKPMRLMIGREEIENGEPLPDHKYYEEDYYGNWHLREDV